MTRELKFRAWEIPDETVEFEWLMHYNINAYLSSFIDNPDYVIMRWTWIKDINWKDLYECDTVMWSWKIYSIVWHNCWFVMQWENEMEKLDIESNVVIIWNINPEILNLPF